MLRTDSMTHDQSDVWDAGFRDGVGAGGSDGVGAGASHGVLRDTATEGFGLDPHEEQCERVHRTLKRVVKARGALDTQEAAALREANKLKLWRAYGCASLVEYMEREMGYTARAALERLRVAKAIEELPVLGDAMNQGDLSFSAARELARVATPETQEEWVAAAAEKNVRQIEELVAGHKPGDRPTDAPDPALKTKVLRYEVRMPVAALERRVLKAFEKMRGHRTDRTDDSDFVEACYLALLDQCEAAASISARGTSTSRVRGQAGGEQVLEKQVDENVDEKQMDENVDDAKGSEIGAHVIGSRVTEPRYQCAVTRCTDCKRGWLHGATTVLLSAPELERALCDAIDIGSVDDTEPSRAKRTIPPAIRRHVFHRDQGRCRVPGCRAIANVDCHHLEYLSQGGKHSILNVLLLCEGHHLALHDGGLVIEGDASNAKFTFRPNSDFKRATRAVETTTALRKRGLPRDVVRAAVEATRTHVGRADFTLEQWMEVALTNVRALSRG